MTQEARPVRLRLSRKKGFDLQKLSRETNGLPAVRVARPGPFGNPFSIQLAAEIFDCRTPSAHDHCCKWFRDWVTLPNDDDQLDDLGSYSGTRKQHAKLHARLRELRGKNLACFCKAELACHADVLLELANAEDSPA